MKYDAGCSSRIRILTFYPSRIQGSEQKGTGSWIRNTDQYCAFLRQHCVFASLYFPSS